MIETMTIEVHPSTQGIVILDGSGDPIVLTDEVTPRDARECLSDRLARQVVACRLRYWADAIGAEAERELVDLDKVAHR